MPRSQSQALTQYLFREFFVTKVIIDVKISYHRNIEIHSNILQKRRILVKKQVE